MSNREIQAILIFGNGYISFYLLSHTWDKIYLNSHYFAHETLLSVCSIKKKGLFA